MQEERINSIQLMLNDLIGDTTEKTIRTLQELCSDDMTPPVRVIILGMLIDAWKKSPAQLGIPTALANLIEFSHRNNVFVIHVVELIRVLRIIRGESVCKTPLDRQFSLLNLN